MFKFFLPCSLLCIVSYRLYFIYSQFFSFLCVLFIIDVLGSCHIFIMHSYWLFHYSVCPLYFFNIFLFEICTRTFSTSWTYTQREQCIWPIDKKHWSKGKGDGVLVTRYLSHSTHTFLAWENNHLSWTKIYWPLGVYHFAFPLPDVMPAPS